MTQDTKQEALWLLDKRKTYDYVAMKLKIRKNTLVQLARTHGVTYNPRKPKSQRDIFIEKVKNGIIKVEKPRKVKLICKKEKKTKEKINPGHNYAFYKKMAKERGDI